MGIPGGSAGVVVRIRIERLEPLTGTVSTKGRAEIAFEGWMELIGAVAKLLGSPAHPRIEGLAAPAGSSEEGAES